MLFTNVAIQKRTLAIHVGINVKLFDPVRRRGFNPDTLPDTTAGSVENVRLIQGLLPNWDNIIL